MKTLLFILVQVFANIIQTISGFAGGPLALPPSMQLVGVSTAKSIITFIFLLSTATVAIQYRKHINWKQVAKMLLVMLIGFLPGIWLFNNMPSTLIMIVYGIIVMLIGVWKLIKPNSDGMKGPLGYVALISSGAMQGMFTSGGPFAVIYASSAIKDKHEFRATLSTVWAVLNLYLTFNMYQQGMYDGTAIRLSLYSIIPVFVAIQIGNKISHKINQKTFHKMVCTLLIISGGLLLINAL